MDLPGPGSDAASREHADRERGLESARRSSSLPSGVFRAASPTVERELAQNVGDVFLRHLACTDRDRSRGEVTPPPDPDAERRNHIAPEELAALANELRQRQAVTPPRVDAGLAAERTWILLNLAAHGSPRLRELAARELLAKLGDPDSAVDGFLLAALRESLDAAIAAGEGGAELLAIGEAARRATREPPT